jgi:hypothetical protein
MLGNFEAVERVHAIPVSIRHDVNEPPDHRHLPYKETQITRPKTRRKDHRPWWCEVYLESNPAEKQPIDLDGSPAWTKVRVRASTGFWLGVPVATAQGE